MMLQWPGDCELSQAITYDGALVSAQTCCFGRGLAGDWLSRNRPETCRSICSASRWRAASWKPPSHCDPIFTSWRTTSWHSQLVLCIHHNTAASVLAAFSTESTQHVKAKKIDRLMMYRPKRLECVFFYFFGCLLFLQGEIGKEKKKRKLPDLG